MTVKLLHWSGVIGLIIGFESYHFSQVRYKHSFLNKEWVLRLFSESDQNNRAAPILQLNLVILATLMEYSNWAGPCENVSYVICEQQRRRSACASAQSDQRLCCSLLRCISRFYSRNFKILADLCSWAGQFVSCLVGDSRWHIFSWRGSILFCIIYMLLVVRQWPIWVVYIIRQQPLLHLHNGFTLPQDPNYIQVC